MRKSVKFLSVALAAGMLVGTAAACGKPDVRQSIDESKTQIYVYSVNNGMGYKWVEYFAEQFNAMPENSEYQIVPQTGTMDLTTTLKAQVQAGTTSTNIYFGCQSAITPMITAGLLLDLEDVYSMKVDGENGGTIAEKTLKYKVMRDSFASVTGEGIYAVPYSIGMSGMVFDYQFFLDSGFLSYAETSELAVINAQEDGEVAEVSGRKLKCKVAFGNYAAGDFILTAGRDGKYGTYDDGQAQTAEEFNALIKDIVNTDYVYPFIYSTKYVNAYTPTTYHAVFAQEMGYDNYYNFLRLQGDIKDANGTVQASLTPATGSAAWDTQVVKNAYNSAIEFYYDNIMGKVGSIGGQNISADQMLHPVSFESTSLTHRDAQDKFVSSYRNPSDLGNSAFLIEGCWWEGTEARSTLENLGSYGEREFRYYLYPETTTQVSEKSVIACQDDGCGVLLNNIPAKCDTEEKKAAFIQKCKEFIAYTLSDTALEYYTATTGIPRPFDYTLSSDSYNNLTPFQKNCWDITHDTENVDIIFPNIMDNLSVLRTTGGLKNFTTAKVQIGTTNASYTNPYAAFKSTTNALTVAQYIDGIYRYIDENYNNIYQANKGYLTNE